MGPSTSGSEGLRSYPAELEVLGGQALLDLDLGLDGGGVGEDVLELVLRLLHDGEALALVRCPAHCPTRPRPFARRRALLDMRDWKGMSCCQVERDRGREAEFGQGDGKSKEIGTGARL